jgi:hypothetical protein
MVSGVVITAAAPAAVGYGVSRSRLLGTDSGDRHLHAVSTASMNAATSEMSAYCEGRLLIFQAGRTLAKNALTARTLCWSMIGTLRGCRRCNRNATAMKRFLPPKSRSIAVNASWGVPRSAVTTAGQPRCSWEISNSWAGGIAGAYRDDRTSIAARPAACQGPFSLAGGTLDGRAHRRGHRCWDKLISWLGQCYCNMTFPKYSSG